MMFDPEEIEVRTYPQEASQRCQRWVWKVWQGSKLLDSGNVAGTDSDAKRAGAQARDRILEQGE